MPRAVAADPSERLPWLSDPGFPKPRQPRRSWLPLAVAMLVTGAIALGGWGLLTEPRTSDSAPSAPAAERVALPPPSAAARPEPAPLPASPGEREALRPSAETTWAAAPEAARISEREVRPSVRKPARRARAAPPAAGSARKTASAYDPKAWNSGVRGRIIQVGAFPSSAKAQAQWRRLYARYPLLRPLSPRIIKSRRGGKTWYRLQLGTFSHAHSELLCQRLRATGEGCIVLNMGKRKRA
ncbi:MAG TPA: SPOR domain-containing protein [Sphingomicrobium sp.]|nr:SPOR domain-containing protein [Sphingomicrobium sp.]